MLEIPFVKFETSFIDDPLNRPSLTMWVAGCPFNCKGCQNPELRDATIYDKVSLEKVIEEAKYLIKSSGNFYQSISLIGGDWGLYPDALYEVCAQVTDIDKVLYTGYLFEQLPERVRHVVTYVIDGQYDDTCLSVFPASSNQNVYYNGSRVNPATLPIYERISKTILGV